MKNGLLRQSRSVPQWMGALQVQIMNSMFYVNLVSMGMMILTFWYTAGYQIKDRYLPWLEIWMFIAAAVIVVSLVMLLDYLFILPVRTAFNSQQSAKHNNPAMESLIRLEADIAKIKAKLEIE